MAHQRVHELAVGEVPHLDRPIPGAGHEDQFVEVRAETDAADPLGVGVGTLNRALALAERIPDLDGAVAPPRNDLAVVGGDGNREDILCVTHEARGDGSGGDIPEADVAVPRG